MIHPVRGMRDMSDMHLFTAVVEQIRLLCELHHIQQIETPVVERCELFQRTLGQYTDVVGKEMFTLHSRGDDATPLCLRPELTASAMRLYLAEHTGERPWKVYAYGPLFRYERPQKGRYRQFYQWSIEYVNAESPYYDVQLMQLLSQLFREQLNIEDFSIAVNFLGCREDRNRYSSLLGDFLIQYRDELCETCIDRSTHNRLRVFDCKEDSCQALYRTAPLMAESYCKVCRDEWELSQQLLQQLSVSYWHDPRLVRGLDYYSKLVFECMSDRLRAQKTFCAGGRYDALSTMLGAKQPVPSMGAAIGLDRLLLLCDAAELVRKRPPLIAIVPLGDRERQVALLLADHIVAAGVATETILTEGSLKRHLRYADKIGAAAVVIIGETERQNNRFLLKDLQTGLQQELAPHELLQQLREHYRVRNEGLK